MPICDDEGQLAPWALLVLRATMLYPREGDKWSRFVAAGFVDHALDGLTDEEQREAMRTDTDLLEEIIETPELGQQANREALIAEGFAPHASLAGQILAWLVMARTHHQDLNATIDAMLSAFSDFLADSDRPEGTNPPKSKSFLWDVWTQYKPCAHLWAAALVSSESAEEATAMVLDRTSDLVSVAELFRESAEHLGIFKAGEAGRAPEAFRHTGDIPGIPELPAEFLVYLERHAKEVEPALGRARAEEGSAAVEDLDLATFVSKIWSDEGGFNEAFRGSLQAAMLYPQDSKKRGEYLRSWLLSYMVEADDLDDFLDDESNRPFRRRLFLNVHMTPPFEAVANDGLRNLDIGSATGHILILWLQACSEHPDASPNPTKIISAASMNAEALWGDRARSLSTSVRSLTKYWKIFRPVAHFYGAFVGHEAAAGRGDEGHEWPFLVLDGLDDDGLLRFLSIAEGYRQLALEQKPAVGKELLQVADERVVPPANLAFGDNLPKGFVDSLYDYRSADSK